MASSILVSHHGRKEKQKRRDGITGKAEDIDGEIINGQPGDGLASVVDDELRVE